MNWNWPGRQGNNVLTDNATTAETRLKAIKRSLKSVRKSIEDSLRTSNSRNKNEELEVRKTRCTEFVLGENVAGAVHVLNEEKGVIATSFSSPLNTILERYANFEKTIGHMLAVNEMEIASFLQSDTPIAKLLDKEIPAVLAAKKDLEQIIKRHQSAQSALEKETRKLDKMHEELDEKGVNSVSEESIHAQEEKRDKLAYDVENLAKEVNLEQDKLTSTLLTLVSRENRYASSLLELMQIKKQFYANAFNLISVELPNIERILNETHLRPVFGERLEDHLQATGRTIAFPIRLAVTHLRESGLNDEGLFRISPKQIKLDKVKSFIDSNLTNVQFQDLLADGDSHLHSALLKSYLRELPEPLLGRKNPDVYNMWCETAVLRDGPGRIKEIQRILKENLPTKVVVNIQYLVKFLNELSKNSDTTKMTPFNIAIVLGPTLLWSECASSLSEQSNIERVISVVTTLIDHYRSIFVDDLDFSPFEEEELKQVVLANKNNVYTGDMSFVHDEDKRSSKIFTTQMSSMSTSAASVTSANVAESHSPIHKRSNILKSKFLSKINPGSPQKPIAEEPMAPTVTMNDL